jgi:hypothetical protein
MTTARKRSFLRRLLPWLPLLLIVALLAWWAWQHRFGTPDDYDRMEAQFKYGSIGADHPLAQAPLPYWIWKVLPDLFPPGVTARGGLGRSNGQPGFAAFGMVSEDKPDMPRGWQPGQPRFDRPIGVSKRRVLGVDLVGLNCAFCHQGTIRVQVKDKDQVKEVQRVVLGGTGHNVDIEQYFLFLFSSLQDPGFTAERVMPAIEKELERQGAKLGWMQRLLYRWILIPFLPGYVAWMEETKFSFIDPENAKRLSEFGPGRVATWALYQSVFQNPPVFDTVPGVADFPPLWNQKARVGMRLHWDGNTDVLVERNVISALSLIGRRIEYLDFERLTRVTEWIEGLVPPRYEDNYSGPEPAIDAAKAQRGADVFQQQCARCHAATGDRLGRVETLPDLGTDPERLKDFTPSLSDALNQLGTKQWQLRNFRVQNGYVNNLLDGIWLRGPYLHNGSVPTLADLLNDPKDRPPRFCRGSDRYDWQRLGFESAVVLDPKTQAPNCPKAFLYDTAKPGNGNAGHLYGTSLPEPDKAALIEFMKTL